MRCVLGSGLPIERGRIGSMNPGTLGWALIVVGSLIGVAGGLLVFVGQQMVSDPDRLVRAVVAGPEQPEPVLNAKQQKLLERIWSIQRELGLEYLVIGLHGRVHFDDEELREQNKIDLKVETFRGEPAPEGARADPEFEVLLDGMPERYLKRLDRADPNKYLRMGRFAVVSVTDAGVRYLRSD